MELLDLPQLATRAGLPLSQARYYRDRFIMFVPSVRVGRTIMHPMEAVGVVRTIQTHAAAGAGVSEIEEALSAAYPITVITSQDVGPMGAPIGAFGAVKALAEAIDNRGAALQTEIALLNEKLSRTATTDQLHSAMFESQLFTDAKAESAESQLRQMKSVIDELREQVNMLASREQLEWIGDVVSAAVLRPTENSAGGVIDRKLSDIHEEIKRPRPSDDAAELRVAVERLTEHVHRRDAEFQRAFQTLVTALRAEMSALHGAMGGIKNEMKSNPEPAPAPVPQPETKTEPIRKSARNVETANGHLSSRSPRRLGQPNRPAELHGPDFEAAHGAH